MNTVVLMTRLIFMHIQFPKKKQQKKCSLGEFQGEKIPKQYSAWGNFKANKSLNSIQLGGISRRTNPKQHCLYSIERSG